MATVTGGGSTTFINVGSNDGPTSVAQNLANVISAGLQNGTLTRVANSSNNPPTGFGVATVSTAAPLIVDAPAVSVDLINAGGSVRGGASMEVVGSGLPNQMVIGDNENITYFTNGGGGTFIFGDGNDIFGTPTIGGGVISNVQTGTGNDTINIFSGLATVNAGAGNNLINTGTTGTTARSLIFASGNDTVRSAGGTGTDTVISGNGTTVISEATKNVIYNGDGGTGSVTVNSGFGSYTVFAGLGGGVVSGGLGGNNVLAGSAGSASTTLFGGGNGDLLFARGSGSTLLVASTGNETLSGGASTAGNTFAAGLGGNTTIAGGVGSDSIYVGNPGSTGPLGGNFLIDGGLGNDLISFANHGAGGSSATVQLNFHTTSSANDKLQLIGFGADQQANVVNAAAGGGTVTLSDGTKITFLSAVSLNSSNFA